VDRLFLELLNFQVQLIADVKLLCAQDKAKYSDIIDNLLIETK
jgi:hypothetical protein